MEKLLGKFDFGDLDITTKADHYDPPRELRDEIERYWDKAKQVHGEKLWNGVNYRLDKVRMGNGRTVMELGTADYKVNFASKHLAQKIRKLPWELRPRCMYISTLLETADQKYILGLTASSGVHGRTRALVGGILNQDEQLIESGNDLERYLHKELEEEFGIGTEAIAKSIGVGVYEMGTCRVGVFVHTRLTVSAAEFAQIVRMNEEHEGYAVMTPLEVAAEAKTADTNINTGVMLVMRDLGLI
jgi:hypothetical protein